MKRWIALFLSLVLCLTMAFAEGAMILTDDDAIVCALEIAALDGVAADMNLVEAWDVSWEEDIQVDVIGYDAEGAESFYVGVRPDGELMSLRQPDCDQMGYDMFDVSSLNDLLSADEQAALCEAVRAWAATACPAVADEVAAAAIVNVQQTNGAVHYYVALATDEAVMEDADADLTAMVIVTWDGSELRVVFFNRNNGALASVG